MTNIKDNTFIIAFLFIVAYALTTVLLIPILLVNAIRLRGNYKDYLYNVLISLDQFAGTLLYNQTAFTISSYTYYLAHYKDNLAAKVFEKFIDALFFKGHCEKSFEGEIQDYKELLAQMEGIKNEVA